MNDIFQTVSKLLGDQMEKRGDALVLLTIYGDEIFTSDKTKEDIIDYILKHAPLDKLNVYLERTRGQWSSLFKAKYMERTLRREEI